MLAAVTAAVLLVASHLTGLLHSVGVLPPTFAFHNANLRIWQCACPRRVVTNTAQWQCRRELIMQNP